MKKLFAALSVLLCATALAQPYPNKPVRLIVAFPPGGPVDIIARLVSPKMTELLGQNVIVENRTGANGNLAAAQIARATPDGYTLLATSSSFAVNQTLTPNPGYDGEKDFIPVAIVGRQPNVIVVNAGFAARTLAELLDMARTQKLAFASPSSGTTPHLTAENLFHVRAKVDITHVPFRGAGPATTAVVSGEPPIGSLAASGPMPFIKQGKLRALAVSAASRIPLLPDVPTLNELGFSGMEDYTWVGVFAPTGTPAEVVRKLNDSIARAVQTPEVRERLDAFAFEPATTSPSETAAYVRAELVKWGQVVRDTGAKLD
jgi:tripartite-type tricarboxylate transporter receptor subunit TctC